MDASIAAVPKSRPHGFDIPPTKEIRIAVVMYGGVSLAIYMNGVTQELLSLVRATSGDPPRDGSTEAVYLELARHLGGGHDGPGWARFVVDLISGTSAGGINGVFLAKALAKGGDLAPLKDVWIEEGDLGKLLNDGLSADPCVPPQVPPRSLLSGERMYVKLFEALARMDAAAVPARPLVEDLELAVTATDLLGRVVPLSLSDGLVWERKHKHVFRFRYSSEDGADDFGQADTPFLAFAARCTSSFPVAFEPMQLATVRNLVGFGKVSPGAYPLSAPAVWDQSLARWQVFFGEPCGGVRDADRYYTDGGVLNNRPFSPILEALDRVKADVPHERKLFYIEPSPEHPEWDPSGKDAEGRPKRPDALQNALAALVGLPSKQPIRDSLLQLKDRNALIRRIGTIVTDVVETLLGSLDLGEDYEARAFDTGRFRDEVATHPALRAYQGLKTATVIEDLARRVARVLGYPDRSEEVLSLQALVRAWFEVEYGHDTMAFLIEVDISYRLRRIQFVKGRIQALLRKDPEALRLAAKLFGQAASEVGTPAFRSEAMDLWHHLNHEYLVLLQCSRKAQSDAAGGIHVAIRDLKLAPDDLYYILTGKWGVLAGSAVPADLEQISHREERARELLRKEAIRLGLDGVRDAIVNHYRPALEVSRQHIRKELADRTGGSPRAMVRRAAFLFFDNFDYFDAAILPITTGTDAGELVPVEVARISPEDAVAIRNEVQDRRPKLAGTALAHFGAFLERSWRRNDLLWGRLDGAERLIRTLAAGHIGSPALVDRLIDKAHQRIIAEELSAQAQADAAGLVLGSLLEDLAPSGRQSGPAAREQRELVKRLTGLPVGSPDPNPGLMAFLLGALNPAGLRRALQEYAPSREPNRKNALAYLSRSVRILGRILEDIGQANKLHGQLGAHLAQAGSFLWGLVQVSIPGSMAEAVFRHFTAMACLFGALMVATGLAFSLPVTQAGYAILVLAVALHVLTRAVRYRLLGRPWARVLAALGGILVLLGLGWYLLPQVQAKVHGLVR
ncbi:patatin-like protein [Mesoterricola sediminis]|uniref:Patatin-related protein n=1 Tax=Mesoterricola sediminis TaxID=2927980 RepID=A0AA48H2S9_9BACT|nr:patatin-like protein [Mesoterricola sediminis]BDU76426.1 hypothetical protein METESE_13840 [Mesoterricola sediminis]